MRIGLFHRLDQLVLTRGQVHSIHIEAFRLVLVVPPHHDHGDVGILRHIHRLSERLGACFGCVLSRILAFHPHTQRIGHLDAASRPFFDSIQWSDRRLEPHQRASTTAGSRHGSIRSDHGDRVDLCRIERQQAALVLQQHDPFGRPLERDGALFRSVHLAFSRMRMVKEAAQEHHPQDAADVVVKRCLADVPGLDLGENLLGLEPGSAVAAHDGARA